MSECLPGKFYGKYLLSCNCLKADQPPNSAKTAKAPIGKHLACKNLADSLARKKLNDKNRQGKLKIVRVSLDFGIAIAPPASGREYKGILRH
jgi:hypothetical protein